MSLLRVLLSLAVVCCLFVSTDVNAAGLLNLSEANLLEQQGTAPPGANNPLCKPSADHPIPVVLVPGTFETMEINWVNLAPLLASKGYCVYSLNYGETLAGPSTGPIEKSAEELDHFIDKVLEHTGAKKVSLVGHSQGGMMPRYYIKNLGGAKKVDDLIGLVPSNHGTNGAAGLGLTLTAAELAACTACTQQKTSSDFLASLNEGVETPGNVSYTVVTTKTDEVVVPYSSAFLSGPEKQLTNITLQDYYPLNLAEHLFVANDPNAFNFVLDALEHDGPAIPERAVHLAQGKQL